MERYVNSHGLQEAFRDIMPIYAATRVRSIVFYMKMVGNDDMAIQNALASALLDSGIPTYLHRAISENLIDGELMDTVKSVLEKAT